MPVRLFSVVALWLCALLLRAQEPTDHLVDNTVVIVRHAEKPAKGTGLTQQGEMRADMYATYFEPLNEPGMNFKIDALYAGADSDKSSRPRLTLGPLSQATGLPVHTEAGTNEPARLVVQLRREVHGAHPLIAWRHGHIPALLQAFGADPNSLLPDGKWPDNVYDWIIVLHFDDAGRLESQQRLQESLRLPMQ